jgi:hypothetical protein
MASDASGNSTTCSFVIVVQGVAVSGYVNYYNNANTSMKNVTVILRQGSTDMYTTTTNNTDGQYSFSNVCAGTYNVVFTTAKNPGGINSSDAAQVNAWGVGPQYWIQKVRFFAGDVVPTVRDNQLQAADAGRILSYFVTGGVPPITPKWNFWKTNDSTITQNPLPNVLTLTVPAGVGSLTQNYYALAAGDFNRSFTPGSAKSMSESLTLLDGETRYVEPNSVIDMPIMAGEKMKVGAISLILNFPSDKLEILGVTLGNDDNSPVQYNVAGDELRIGWYSMNPLNLDVSDRLLTLKTRVIGSLTKEDIIRFVLAPDDLTELADQDYITINDAKLTMDLLSGAAMGTGEVLLSSKLALANHPNPFKGTTTFTYTLPVDGKVTLEIYSVLGAKVMNLMGEQQVAGNHTYTVDATILVPGVYTATLRLVTPEGEYTKTIKIVRNH